MATVFDVFKEVQMEYLPLNRGRVFGNLTGNARLISGIFKLRTGMTANGGTEAFSSSATVHAHPEDFEEGDKIVGNGIEYNGELYEIVGLTEGRNFDTNEVEHLTLTLNRGALTQQNNYNVVEDEFV